MINSYKSFSELMYNTTKNDIMTYEKGTAYKTSFEDDLCTIFTLGCFNNKFYEDAQTTVNDLNDIFKKALFECPYLATQYAIYSTEELRMKLIPTIWLVYLSTLNDKTLFTKAFPRIINKNIKLIHDFINICRSTQIRPGGHLKQRIKNNNRGIGSGIKKVINNYLYEILNDYNTTRFTSKLEDICHVTRIKDTDNSKKYLDYIFKPKNQERRLTFERAKCLDEVIKILSNTEEGFPTEAQLNVVFEYISKYQIQMDEIKFTFGNLSREILQKVYSFFIPILSYAALIINLVAIERVFSTSTVTVRNTFNSKTFSQEKVLETNIPIDIINIVKEKICNYQAYKNSGLFFMRLYSASKMVITSEWVKALNNVFLQAAKEAFKDIPSNMHIRCSADTSGSMRYHINESIQAIDVAAYFTAACAISIPNTKAYATATITKEVPIITDNIIVEADRIKNTNVGYGTYFSTLLNNYNNENIVLIITDTQQADNAEVKWIQLQKPTNAKFIIWDVTGYVNKNIISQDKSILYLRGYSDRILSVVTNLILGKAGQKEIVHAIQI